MNCGENQKKTKSRAEHTHLRVIKQVALPTKSVESNKNDTIPPLDVPYRFDSKTKQDKSHPSLITRLNNDQDNSRSEEAIVKESAE